MLHFCPRGCHNKPGWTFRFVNSEEGELCQSCGACVEIHDPEAERDYRIYLLKRWAVIVGVPAIIGIATALIAAWVG